MKYSFMSFSTPELSLQEMLDVAKKYGYEGIEPRLTSKHGHGIEVEASADQRAVAKKMAQDSGVKICCLASSARFANPETAPAVVAETLAQIDLAADVGAPCIRVFGGKIPEGISREEAIQQVSDCLAGLADHASQRGVTLCMETHDDWCDANHVAAVIRRVNHPAIRVNWDIMHPIRAAGMTMDSAYQPLQSLVQHVHFHDGTLGALTLLPVGEGKIDHKRSLQILKGAGYDGFLSGEWIKWEPWEKHLPREIARMKQYEQEG